LKLAHKGADARGVCAEIGAAHAGARAQIQLRLRAASLRAAIVGAHAHDHIVHEAEHRAHFARVQHAAAFCAQHPHLLPAQLAGDGFGARQSAICGQRAVQRRDIRVGAALRIGKSSGIGRRIRAICAGGEGGRICGVGGDVVDGGNAARRCHAVEQQRQQRRARAAAQPGERPPAPRGRAAGAVQRGQRQRQGGRPNQHAQHIEAAEAEDGRNGPGPNQQRSRRRQKQAQPAAKSRGHCESRSLHAPQCIAMVSRC